MKSIRVNHKRRSRGIGLIIWSCVFILLSFILPGVATIISTIIALCLHKYPERRKAEIILVAISIIVTIVLLITGYLTGSWSSFIAGWNSVQHMK